MEPPISHHGAARPDVKNSVVLDPARRMSRIAGTNERIVAIKTIDQSKVVNCTREIISRDRPSE
jgi:hypothetical protein